MSGRLPPPFFTALDANGNPYAGAKLYFYVTGTSTPKDTYSDAALSTPNANPVVADAGGVFGSIFMSNEAYKVVLKTSADVTVWTADPVRGPFSSGDVSIAGYALLASTNSFTATQTFQLTDNGATAGPEIILDRNSASPAASDRIGNALFRGRDSGGNNETYAEVQAAIIDPTAASEDGALVARTVIAGTLADRVLIGAGLYTSGVTGGDPGAGKINAAEVQVAGVALPITKVFTSTDQTITAAGTLTIAHGLGVVPKALFADLVCQTGEHGYSAGDVVPYPIGADGNDATASNAGISVRKTSSDLILRFGQSASGNTMYVIHATSGNLSGITNGNWKIRFHAFA